MANNVLSNSLRKVAHIVKFNGENHHEWNYEVVSMLEQLDLKNLLIEPSGGVLSTLPAEVTRTFFPKSYLSNKCLHHCATNQFFFLSHHLL